MKKENVLSILNYVAVVAIIVLIHSCSKDSDTEKFNNKASLDQLIIPRISNFTVNSKNNPEKNSINNKPFGDKRVNTTPPQNGNNPFKLSASTYKDGSGTIVIGNNSSNDQNKLFFLQKYKSQMFTISDQSMGLNIYPGAILRGQSIEGIFSPQMLIGISNNIRPITISTSMPVSGSSVARTSLPRPISERALFKAALADLENSNLGEIGAASLIVEMDTLLSI